MGRRDFGTIIRIGDILVSEDVVLEWFCCDYDRCKGCCCIIGDSGAPLEASEPELLEAHYPAYSPLMQPEGRTAVAAQGFFTIDRDGDRVTPLVPGSEACAYAHFDAAGHCFCAIERAHLGGACPFRKPVSCWLYPIRVTRLRGGGLALNVHHWDICRDAFAKGQKEKVRVYEFLREPLISAFGEEFYSALSAAARRLTAAS